MLGMKGLPFTVFQVSLHKEARHVMIPLLCKRHEALIVFLPDLVIEKKAAIGRIVKRPYHAGNIAQRRAFQPSFAIAACGLAFKVGNNKVLAGIQYLSQVVIAVNTDLHHIYLLLVDTFKGVEYIALSWPALR